MHGCCPTDFPQYRCKRNIGSGHAPVQQDILFRSSASDRAGLMQEGELRPQLLDRFGMSVNVLTMQDVPARTRMVMDRMAFERVRPLAYTSLPTRLPAWLMILLLRAMERRGGSRDVMLRLAFDCTFPSRGQWDHNLGCQVCHAGVYTGGGLPD